MLERTAIFGEASPAVTPDSVCYRHLSYQPHVDGLRAVAVLAVVGFHALPQWVPGGFVGVDIFFVISGYLICGIIFASLDAGGFSFAEFYARRIRRIFPALAIVLAATLAIAWQCMLSDEFELFGNHLAWSAGFLVNFKFAQEHGYFDLDSTTNPLLHLWSLGVEEQFYIVWPLVLFVAWKCRTNLLAISAAVLVASLVFNIAAAGRNPVAAFYLPWSRFWELQVGAVLVYVALRHPSLFARWSESSALFGLILVGVAVVGLGRTTLPPGCYALVPTVGAALVIGAGRGALANRWLLESPVIVAIGLISYPLYLWHWPLFAFARILQGEAPSPSIAIGIVLTSVVLAWATYRFIERPIRFGAYRAPKALGLGAAMTALGSLGVAIFASGGLPERRIATAYAAVAEAHKDWIYVEGDYPLPMVLRGTSDNQVVFIGDSHMEQYAPRAIWLYETQKPALTAVFATVSGCPPFGDTHIRADGGLTDCDQIYASTITSIEAPPVKKVAIAAAWSLYVVKQPPNIAGRLDETLAQFGRLIASLTNRGVQVYVLLSNPTGREFDPRNRPRWSAVLSGDVVVDRRAVSDSPALMQRISALARSNGAVVIDPTDYICGPATCQAVIDGKPIYADAGHLRASFARQRAKFMDAIILH